MTILIKEELKNFVRPTPHSTFSPSSGDRWMACPASIRLSQGIPNRTSIYAKEGTLAHKLCEEVFAREMYGMAIPNSTLLELAQLEDNGEEMMAHAEDYGDVIRSWLDLEAEIGDVLWFGIERGIPIFPEEGCFGTGDCIIIGTNGAACIDFKYGKGKKVSADTVQLRLYLLGMMNYMDNIPEDYQWHAIVYQPRTDIIPKVHTYYTEQLEEFGVEVWNSIQATKLPDAAIVKDNSHCWFCPARQTPDPAKKCPAIKQEVIDAANQNFDKFISDMHPQEDGPGKSLATFNEKDRDAALVKILSLAPLIKSMAELAEQELLFRLGEKKEAIEGVMLRKKLGNRRWSDKKTIADSLVKLWPADFNEDNVYKIKKAPLGITEVEKLLGKGSVDSFVERPESETIVIQDEKQKEILDSMSRYSKLIRSE